MAGTGAPTGRIHKRKAISDQQKRREQSLRRQNENRLSAQYKARFLAKVLLNSSSHDLDDHGSALSDDKSGLFQDNIDIEMEDKEAKATKDEQLSFRKAYSLKGHRARQWFSRQLMIPEWMVDIPPRLKHDWYVLPRPAGVRCLVISINGTTLSRTRNGRILHRFPSALPNGSKCRGVAPDSSYSILDCIFHERDQTYYVIDIICWRGYSLHNCSSEFRFFWLYSKLSETEASNPPSTHHRYPFKTVPIYECDQAGLQAAYYLNVPYVRDGLLFYNRQAQYEPGLTPLCLVWKDRHISEYFIDTDKSGAVPIHQQIVLELQEDGTVGTADDPPVALTTLSEDFIQQNKEHCKPGILMRFAVSDEGVQIIDGKPVVADLQFQGFVVRTRAFPDSCSKILFQHAARKSPLTFEELFASIDNTDEEGDAMVTG